MKNIRKSENGFTTIDLAIALFIAAIFVTIVSSITYSIYTSSTEARKDAMATNYAVAVFEKVGSSAFDAIDGENMLRAIPDIKGIDTVDGVTTGYVGTSEENYQFKFAFTSSDSYDDVKNIGLKIDYKVKAGQDGVKSKEFSRLKLIKLYEE